MNTQTQTHTNRTGGAAQANNLVVLLSGVRNEFSGCYVENCGHCRHIKCGSISPMRLPFGPSSDLIIHNDIELANYK